MARTTPAALKRRSRSSSPFTISRGVTGRASAPRDRDRAVRPLKKSVSPPKRPGDDDALASVREGGSVSPSESALGATSSFSLGSSTAPRVVAPPENEPTASYCRSSAIKVPKTGIARRPVHFGGSNRVDHPGGGAVDLGRRRGAKNNEAPVGRARTGGRR